MQVAELHADGGERAVCGAGMHPGAQSPGSAFRRVNSSCNTFGGIPQSPMSGRPGGRAAFGEPGSRAGFGPPAEHPMSYPASPAARTIDRRWSFSGAPPRQHPRWLQQCCSGMTSSLSSCRTSATSLLSFRNLWALLSKRTPYLMLYPPRGKEVIVACSLTLQYEAVAAKLNFKVVHALISFVWCAEGVQ